MTSGRRLAILVAAACVGLAVAWVREGRRDRGTGPGPERAGGRTERCLTCHVRPDEGPEGAHAAAAVGCEPCHLGNPLAYDKDRAHAGMEREPGALDTVGRTCGREGCHPREAGHVATSLMATGRGLIAVDRRVLGETSSWDGTGTFETLLGTTTPTPAEDHLRRLCAGCHLRTRGENRDDAVHGTGSGCGACHASRRPPLVLRAHPPVDGRVPDDRCLGCHSRSGRISLSYAGLAEVRDGQQVPGGVARLFDGRPAARVRDDVHHEKGMACTDCHLHVDAMGDGIEYAHQEQQVAVTCEACHGPVAEDDQRSWAAVDDAVSQALARMRGVARTPLEMVRTGRRAVPLWNLRPASAVPAAPGTGGTSPDVPGRPAQGSIGAPSTPATWVLLGKIDERLRTVRQTPADANHRLKGHERLSCQSCHAAWAPSCATCHTRYDADGRQWDFGRGAVAKGAWVEEAESYGWGPPALAVRGDRVVTAIPGMILDVDATGAGGTREHRRLYAALDPHTTRKESRSCASCHASSVALGLGTGTLDLGGDEPRFTPADPSPGEPGMARDGWTSLFPDAPAPGTRTDVRSLDAREQRRVLRVGPCLPCHAKADDAIYRDLDRSVRALGSGTTRCRFKEKAFVDL